MSELSSLKIGTEYTNQSALTSIPSIWRNYTLFDAHSHIGDFPDMNIYGRTITDLLDYMNVFNIRYSAVSCITRKMTDDNDKVAAAVKAYPDRVVGLAHINPSLGKIAVSEVERCTSMGLRGVKLHPWFDFYCVADIDMTRPVFEKISEEKIPVLVHTGNYPMSAPIHLTFLAREFPDIRFICAHMGVDSIAEAMLAAEYSPNVFLETSGSSSAGQVELAVRRIGADKVLWGTDPPYGKFVAEFYKIMSLDISEEDRQAILWANAARIYGVAS